MSELLEGHYVRPPLLIILKHDLSRKQQKVNINVDPEQNGNSQIPIFPVGGNKII